MKSNWTLLFRDQKCLIVRLLTTKKGFCNLTVNNQGKGHYHYRYRNVHHIFLSLLDAKIYQKSQYNFKK
jgi:hypothetical protein